MKRMPCTMQYGLSLVELMIAMALGLFVVGMAMQVFLTGKSTYRTVSATSAMLDDMRYSLYLFQNDVRMAGYRGCVTRGDSIEITNTLKDSSDIRYDFLTGIRGFDNVVGVPTVLSIPLLSDPQPLSGTDLLVLRSTIDNAISVSKENSPTQLFITKDAVELKACSDDTSRINGICASDILMVSDCTKARIFQATGLSVTGSEVSIAHESSGSPGNDISTWGGGGAPVAEVFTAGSEIVRVATVVYYVATSPDTLLPSLFRKENNQAATFIAEGVQDVQLEYGVDSNEDFEVDSYQTADAVLEWDTVLAVRIRLHLISAQDRVVENKQVYTFNGVTATASDYRLHYAMTNTVTLRNRAP